MIKQPRLSKLELMVMGALWRSGPLSAREIQESFPEESRPAFTTVQTIIYRLEVKGALRRTKKISNANIFEAVITQDSVQRRAVHEILGLFGGQIPLLMARLFEASKLTPEEFREAAALVKKQAKKRKKA